jgi:hypothetical protein
MRALGFLGAAVQLAFAVVLGVGAGGSSDFPDPPEVVPRGLAMGLLYATPAVIGALGAIGRRRSVLAAAAAATTIGSVLSFSGVTLIFLVPGLLFAAAAGATARAGRSTSLRSPWRPMLFTVVAVPAAVLAVLTYGVFGIAALVLVVVILEVMRGASPAPLSARLTGLAVGIVVVGLLVGSGWALLATTETRCWAAYETPAGIEYRTMPESERGPIHLNRDAIGGGCNGGELTVRGAAIAALLAVGAIGVASVASETARG